MFHYPFFVLLVVGYNSLSLVGVYIFPAVASIPDAFSLSLRIDLVPCLVIGS